MGADSMTAPVSLPKYLLKPLGIAFLSLQVLLGSACRGAPDESVAFNTQSLTYHCVECESARQCTVNCIVLPKSEAVRRGGVACRVCGGSCKRGRETR